MSAVDLNRAQRQALLERTDLLAEEAQHVREQGITWRARVNQLGDYGRSGGSAYDRRLVIEAMAEIERGGR